MIATELSFWGIRSRIDTQLELHEIAEPFWPCTRPDMTAREADVRREHMITSRLGIRVLAGCAVFAAAAAAQIAPSMADTPKIAVGTLTCHGKGTVGYIFGSKQNLRCNFETPVSGRSYRYAATITKVGLDIGIKGDSTMIWTVLGPTTNIPSEALEGNYGGVTAGAAVGIGGNANALIGGSSQSIILQPVSVEGQTGLNVSAGVAGLTIFAP